MRNVQLMKEKKYIFRVYHIRIIAKQIGSHDMKQTDSSIIIVRNVCVLTSASMIVSFLREVMIGNHRNKTTES